MIRLPRRDTQAERARRTRLGMNPPTSHERTMMFLCGAWAIAWLILATLFPE